MNFRLCFFAAGILVLTTHAGLVFGAEDGEESLSGPEEALEEGFATSASGRAQTIREAPATVTLIGGEDLLRCGIRTLDEAIDYLGLGMVTQNPLHSVDIGARGVLLTADFGNHVVLLLDGQVMNEPWGGTAYFERGSAIPIELIDHIEISLGPGSVTYGGNAMFGVVNVVTRRARDYSGTRLVLDGELLPSSTGESKDIGRGFRAAAGHGREFEALGYSGELVGQIEYYAQQGPALEFGRSNYGDDAVTGEPKKFSPDGSLAGVWGGIARSSYSTRVPAALVRLGLGRLDVQLRGALYDRSTPYSNLFNAFVGDFDAKSAEGDRFLGFQVRHTAVLAEGIDLSTRVFGNLYDYDQRLVTSAAEDCLEGQLDGCRPRSRGRSAWAGVQEQVAFDGWGGGLFDTLLGGELRLRRVGGNAEYFDRLTGASRGLMSIYQMNEVVAAVYLQQNATVFERLRLNGGARLDRDPRVGTRLSLRAAAVLDVEGGATVRLVYAEAFRGPTT